MYPCPECTDSVSTGRGRGEVQTAMKSAAVYSALLRWPNVPRLSSTDGRVVVAGDTK